jgi:hypothetical protein
LTHIGATAVFQAVALSVVDAEGYHGPLPLYFEIMIWPIMFLFAALAVSAAWRHVGEWLLSTVSAVRQYRLVVRHGLPLGVIVVSSRVEWPGGRQRSPSRLCVNRFLSDSIERDQSQNKLGYRLLRICRSAGVARNSVNRR